MTPLACWQLLRHAATSGVPGRFLGSSDRAITPVDSEVVAGLVRAIGRIEVAVITPLRRTVQTLELLQGAGLLVPQVLVEPGLVEQDFGDWEERDYDRLAEADPAYWPFWTDPVRRRPPGGESFVDVCARAVAAWQALDQRLAGAEVLHVGHAGPIRALLALAGGGGPTDAVGLEVAPLSLRRLSDGGTGKPVTGLAVRSACEEATEPGQT